MRFDGLFSHNFCLLKFNEVAETGNLRICHLSRPQREKWRNIFLNWNNHQLPGPQWFGNTFGWGARIRFQWSEASEQSCSLRCVGKLTTVHRSSKMIHSEWISSWRTKRRSFRSMIRISKLFIDKRTQLILRHSVCHQSRSAVVRAYTYNVPCRVSTLGTAGNA